MSYEPPTLEGRVLVDLGQQLTAMRARAEQAEAENARLREALRQARAFIGDDFDPQDGYDASLAAHLDAALAATPEKRGTKATA